MEREQEEMKFLGFIGIYKESLKIISSRKKLFAQISLALILPLCLVFLAHSWISQTLYYRIINDSINRYDTFRDTESYARLSRSINSAGLFLALANVAYFILVLVLSLLSTSAVVYTVFCIYTGKDVNFRKVLAVVPRVWKRLVVTFLCSFAIFFIYIIFSGGIIVAIVLFVRPYYHAIIIAVVLLLLFVMGLLYLTMILQLASVVSVLEDVYGRKAIVKSKALIKGRLRISVGCFAVLVVLFVVVQLGFEFPVVIGLVPGLVNRILIGLVFSVLLLGIVLLELVLQTVLYLVCKTFHHENIDKPSSADHLELHNGDNVPLGAQAVRLGEIQV